MLTIIGTCEELAKVIVRYTWKDDDIFVEFTYNNNGKNIGIKRLIEKLHNQYFLCEPVALIPEEDDVVRDVSLHFLNKNFRVVFNELMTFDDLMCYLSHYMTLESIGFEKKEF